MFGALFVARSLAAETGNGCPPGVEYYFDRTINVTIEPKSWYYFYTSHANRDEPLFYDIKSEQPVTLYIGQNSRCPNAESEPTADIPGGNRLTSVHIPCENQYAIIVSGLYSEEGTTMTLKLMGQRTNKNTGMPPYVKVIILFITMLAALGIYFVHCVLPPLKKEKQD